MKVAAKRLAMDPGKDLTRGLLTLCATTETYKTRGSDAMGEYSEKTSP